MSTSFEPSFIDKVIQQASVVLPKNKKSKKTVSNHPLQSGRGPKRWDLAPLIAQYTHVTHCIIPLVTQYKKHHNCMDVETWDPPYESKKSTTVTTPEVQGFPANVSIPLLILRHVAQPVLPAQQKSHFFFFCNYFG